MKSRAIEHFTFLYICTSRHHPMPKLNLYYLGSIKNEDNTRLWHFQPMEEFERTLFTMARDKALSPHGVTVGIIIHHWNSIKEDFWQAILYFFQRRRMLTSVNHILDANAQKSCNHHTSRLSTHLLHWSPLQNHCKNTGCKDVKSFAEPHLTATNDIPGQTMY